MSTEQPIRNRYRGLGGIYVVVDGETFPASEAGEPLPHFLDELGAPIPADPVASTPAPAEPTE